MTIMATCRGTTLLRMIAQRLRNSAGPYDRVGRYGQEEFLVIAQFADVLGTMALAERIPANVESHPIRARPRAIRLTLSLRVAGATIPAVLTPRRSCNLLTMRSIGRKKTGATAPNWRPGRNIPILCLRLAQGLSRDLEACRTAIGGHRSG